jgi:peptidoglycan hydrolase-like protein with peptidoglycan-binding domain
LNRRRLVLVVIGAVVVSSVVTWIANEQIRSPAEVAARAAAPPPTPILVPVEERVLATRIVTRGTAHFGSPRQLSVVPSRLKTGPAVVTSLPSTGSSVREGDVLLTISGRPVFVLRGKAPSYRDLGPGIRGRDVRQLERALQRLGLRPGRVDGLYDSSTEAAVAVLYRRRGHRATVAREAALAASRPREADLVPGSRASAGVQLPADEVVFVPTTPLRVTELVTSVGARPAGGLVTVTGSEVVIDGTVRVEQADQVREGAKVQIDEPALGINANGRVSGVAGRPGTGDADQFHVAFEVAVDDPPAALVGTSVRLTIPVESTRKSRLTVPVSAVSLGPDGGSRVQRQVAEGFEFLPVRTGLSADGFVTVTPIEGQLADGDMVIVGFDRNGARPS